MQTQRHVYYVTTLAVCLYLGLFCVEHNINIIAFKGKQGAKAIIRLNIDCLKQNKAKKENDDKNILQHDNHLLLYLGLIVRAVFK